MAPIGAHAGLVRLPHHGIHGYGENRWELTSSPTIVATQTAVEQQRRGAIQADFALADFLPDVCPVLGILWHTRRWFFTGPGCWTCMSLAASIGQ